MAHKIALPGLIILAHHPRENWSDLANPWGMYPHFMPFHPELDTAYYLGDIATTKNMHKNGGLIVIIYGGNRGFEDLVMRVKNGNCWSKNPWPIILTESSTWRLPRCLPPQEEDVVSVPVTDITKEFVIAGREKILEHCVQLLLPAHPHLRRHLSQVITNTPGDPNNTLPDPPMLA